MSVTTTRLSSKGQVIIPMHLRAAHRRESGQELMVIELGDGILLKPKSPPKESHISEVAGCLDYAGEAKILEEMDSAVQLVIREKYPR